MQWETFVQSRSQVISCDRKLRHRKLVTCDEKINVSLTSHRTFAPLSAIFDSGYVTWPSLVLQLKSHKVMQQKTSQCSSGEIIFAMIFKLMVNFEAGDTWETIFIIRDRRLERKKINPPVSFLKQLFLKIITLHQRRRYQSDPIRNPILVLLTAPGIMCSFPFNDSFLLFWL